MWPDVEGYGFTLHMEKGKAGQYIGEVSSDTPAYAAGLQTGDRILAVNGRNVIGDSHKEVVRKMKELPGELRLLLCQPKMEEYLRVNDIVLSEDVPGIVVIKCPPTNPQLGMVLLLKPVQYDRRKIDCKPFWECLIFKIISCKCYVSSRCLHSTKRQSTRDEESGTCCI